jgi:hypothetical protein
MKGNSQTKPRYPAADANEAFRRRWNDLVEMVLLLACFGKSALTRRQKLLEVLWTF